MVSSIPPELDELLLELELDEELLELELDELLDELEPEEDELFVTLSEYEHQAELGKLFDGKLDAVQVTPLLNVA